MRIAIAQLNYTVGDLQGNAKKILEAGQAAAKAGARLLVTSELAICGYPPQDLLNQHGFVQDCIAESRRVAAELGELGLAVVIGSPRFETFSLRNSALLYDGAELVGHYDKRLLPTYDIFDERRWFDQPKETPSCLELDALKLGVHICEDAWNQKAFWWDESDRESYAKYRYGEVNPVRELVEDGAKLLINLSASPWSIALEENPESYWAGSQAAIRRELFDHIAMRHDLPILVCNQVGANDGLIFDGNSLASSRDKSTALSQSFLEGLWMYDFDGKSGLSIDLTGGQTLATPYYPSSTEALHVDFSKGFHPDATAAMDLVIEHEDDGLSLLEVQAALEMGVRDYVQKTGHENVIIGLSGGIDSALVTTIACHALGPENVRAIGMPTRYSSEGSISDSEELCKNLGCSFEVYPIEGIFETFEQSFMFPDSWTSRRASPSSVRSELGVLASKKQTLDSDQAEEGASATVSKPSESEPEGLSGLALENIQPRIRGTILMALANQDNALVLAPGNKSELAVGYSTLYGDTVGCLEVIGDLYKSDVYRLSRFYNRCGELIPQSIIDKEPSAELREEQLDSDSLPDYGILDRILNLYVDHSLGVQWICDHYEFDNDLIRKVCRMVDIAEFKRKQSPMVLRVSSRAFGAGRQMPVVNGYRPSSP